MKPSELYMEITKQTGLYNIQSIDNIPSIMKYGLLSYEKASKIEHTSIAMQEIQERRSRIVIPNGMALHKYANVYFDPRNPMLYKRKNENEHICILKFDCSILDFEKVVVSDRNASSDYAIFNSPEKGLLEIDFGLVFKTDWRDDDQHEYYRKKSAKCAEALVPYVIPFNFVVSAAVYSEKAKKKVERTGFDKRIIIDPRFFF